MKFQALANQSPFTNCLARFRMLRNVKLCELNERYKALRDKRALRFKRALRVKQALQVKRSLRVKRALRGKREPSE